MDNIDKEIAYKKANKIALEILKNEDISIKSLYDDRDNRLLKELNNGQHSRRIY